MSTLRHEKLEKRHQFAPCRESGEGRALSGKATVLWKERASNVIQIIVGGLIGFVGSLIAGYLTSDNAKGSTNGKRITAFGVGACVFYSFLAVAFFTGRKLIDNDLRHLARELIKETFVIGGCRYG